MKKPYKYKIGEIVVPSWCTTKYQKRNQLTIKYRRKDISLTSVDETGTKTEYWDNYYSDNGSGWMPEDTIEKL